MSLITITKNKNIPDRKTVLVRSDAKNALPTRTLRESWTELSGLSWVFLENDYDVNLDTPNYYTMTYENLQ